MNKKEYIKKSDTFLNTIDQYLHNKGINKLIRLKLIKYVIYNINKDKLEFDNISNEVLTFVNDIIKDLLLKKSEIIQRIFMFYGSIIMKDSLDQFYTPLTICQFIKNIVNKNSNFIDPSSGTGDLLIEIDGNITLWDISKEATDLAKMNYELFNKDVNIINHDSLLNSNLDNESYDYVVMNPPFGTKTTTNNPDILKNYKLTNNKKKQELGILFIERGLNLLKKNGILFIILPGGYLGNNNNLFLRKFLINNTKIISIIKLPSGTFARSGTGVSTYLLIIKKEKVENFDYNIHIRNVEEIGYELNKKNTPIKYAKNDNNDYILDENDDLIIINDLNDVYKELNQFAFDNDIKQLISKNTSNTYQTVNINEILNDYYNVMEIGRYYNDYKNVIRILNNFEHCKIKDLCNQNVNYTFTLENDKKYNYIDISEVNTPLYNGKKLYGYQLPGRAKNKVKKNDIIISRLRGNISFSIIMDDDDVIVTNGMCVLRPIDEKSLIIIFANIYNKTFITQHQALTTGSIMESISDQDINNIIINKNIDVNKFKKIYNTLSILYHELKSL